MKTDTNAIRNAIRDLDRDGLVRLSKVSSIRRSDLSDFADIGLSLPDDELNRLEIWFEQHQLRRALERMPAAMAEGMAQATGISDSRRDDFIADATTFTADELAKASDYVSGQLGIPKPEPVPMGGAYIGLSLGEIAERGAMIEQLRKLPTSALRALVASLPAQAA